MRDMALSQPRAADLIGVTQQAVNNWLKGNSQPSISNVIAICNALGVRRDWLLYGEGAKKSTIVQDQAPDYARKLRVRKDVDVVLETAAPERLRLFEGIVKTFVRQPNNDQAEKKGS